MEIIFVLSFFAGMAYEVIVRVQASQKAKAAREEEEAAARNEEEES
jgi:hypothetical protein